MSPRTGRPKVENPKTKRYCIRMNEEDAKNSKSLHSISEQIYQKFFAWGLKGFTLRQK